MLLPPSHNQPIESRQQLIDFLLRGARPRSEWGVGLETEKLVVDQQSGEAVGYERIRDLLAGLEGVYGWKGVYEGEFLIGLQGERSSVSLEPGGQLELSGRFCRDIACSWRDLCRYRDQVIEAGKPLGLAFLGLGVQPFTRLEQIDWLPKARYAIMGPYMNARGDMGQRMMKQSAGTQVNFDFCDEQDCVRKMRAGQWLAPLGYALFANSPILEDQPNGFLSMRGEIWSRTDSDRCGLIDALFRADASLADYVEYALDVPLYFLQREGRLVDMTGRRFSFRQFLNEGFQRTPATLADWDLHLSTLFTEVRLRPYVEIRSADSLPPRYTASVAAFYKGLLYTEDALARVEEFFQQISVEDFRQLYRDSWTYGLKSRFADGSLKELATTLLTVAERSLKEQHRSGLSGVDESRYLEPLREIVATGETLAEQLLSGWQGGREEKLALLLERCAYAYR